MDIKTTMYRTLLYNGMHFNGVLPMDTVYKYSTVHALQLYFSPVHNSGSHGFSITISIEFRKDVLSKFLLRAQVICGT